MSTPADTRELIERLMKRASRYVLGGTVTYDADDGELDWSAADALAASLTMNAGAGEALAHAIDQRDYYRGRDAAGAEIESELRAALAGAPAGVRVKPLDWEHIEGQDFAGSSTAIASSVLGAYQAWANGTWNGPDHTMRRVKRSSLTDAMNAAEADYEASILSALAATPNPPALAGDDFDAKMVAAYVTQFGTHPDDDFPSPALAGAGADLQTPAGGTIQTAQGDAREATSATGKPPVDVASHPALAGQQGEPVAWQWSDFSGNWYTVSDQNAAEELAKEHEGRVRALYAAPTSGALDPVTPLPPAAVPQVAAEAVTFADVYAALDTWWHDPRAVKADAVISTRSADVAMRLVLEQFVAAHTNATPPSPKGLDAGTLEVAATLIVAAEAAASHKGQATVSDVLKQLAADVRALTGDR